MSGSGETLPTRTEFSQNLDSLFQARFNDEPGPEFCLVGIDVHVSDERQENFTLLFRAPADSDLQQGIYNLENKELGSMDLFLVPVSRDKESIYLEAVFNHYLG